MEKGKNVFSQKRMGGVNDAVRYQVSGFLEKINSQKKANIAQAHFVLNNNSVSIILNSKQLATLLTLPITVLKREFRKMPNLLQKSLRNL